VARPSAARFKLVEWDPRARRVVAWEAGPDRRLHLPAAGPGHVEPGDPCMRV
jgi:hypothetical protein